jgi:hypothetical protein
MLNELLARPDFIGVLDPDRIVYIGVNGTILDGAKPRRDYPRFKIREFLAVTWQVHTREQWAAHCELIAAEMEARGVHLDNR